MSLDEPLVVCCGLTTFDVLQVVKRVPRSNEKLVAESCVADFGGPAANAAATVVALGGQARLITALGSGALAQLVRSKLGEADVTVVDLASHESADPPVSTVLVTEATGDRAVVSSHASTVQQALTPLGDELSDAAMLLVDGHHMELAVGLAREARAKGIPVLFDGGSWKAGTDALLEFVDIAVVSDDFEPPDGIEPLGFLASAGCAVAATTNGGSPVQVLVSGERREVQVERLHPEEVVDTLGAGDVFHGALAFELAVQGRQSVLEAVRIAAQVASASCRYRGSRGWVSRPSGQHRRNL